LNDPTNSVNALKEDRSYRLGCNPISSPTRLTIIQQICSMKKHTKYTEININKSMHSEMGPV